MPTSFKPVGILLLVPYYRPLIYLAASLFVLKCKNHIWSALKKSYVTRQLVPHLQWNSPVNCCFILRPQFGQICLLAPIAPPFNIEIQLARKLIQIKTCKAA